MRAWHAPSSVKQVRQFAGFIGYYRRFIQNFAGLSEPLVALTRKGVNLPGLRNIRWRTHFGFSNRGGPVYPGYGCQPFHLGGVLRNGQEVVIAYASQSLVDLDDCHGRRLHRLPLSARRSFIQGYHDSRLAGNLGVSRTVYHLLDRVYWPSAGSDGPCFGGSPLGPGGYGHPGYVGYNT